jgi:DNA-binding transcriptional regulator YiaG
MRKHDPVRPTTVRRTHPRGSKVALARCQARANRANPSRGKGQDFRFRFPNPILPGKFHPKTISCSQGLRSPSFSAFHSRPEHQLSTMTDQNTTNQKTDDACLSLPVQASPTEAPQTPFAAVLRAFRVRLGWTQGQAAEWLGMSPRAYEYWECGLPHRVPNRVSQAGAWYLLTQACKKSKV